MTAVNDLDVQLVERAEEKRRATARIAVAISAIEAGGRQPDLWERVFLAQAIAALFAGAYRLAEVDAALSLTPKEERSPFPNLLTDPIFDRCDIAVLRTALRQAESEDVRRFPTFGPPIFIGDTE
jgi:hypothetical protein